MKKLVSIIALCALLLTAMVMPAAAASNRNSYPDTASAVTLLLRLLGGFNQRDCTVALPTQPGRPAHPCGETECASGVDCTATHCDAHCDIPADSGCADLGTCPTTPQPPREETPSVTEPARPGSTMSAYEREVVRLVNEIRAQHGIAALTENSALADVARAKSADMSRNNYFDHQSPTYGSPFNMMRAFGISYRTAAENIAMGYRTPAAVVQGWMDSPTHRAAMLSPGYTQTGVGYVANGNYWTQMFIS